MSGDDRAPLPGGGLRIEITPKPRPQRFADDMPATGAQGVSDDVGSDYQSQRRMADAASARAEFEQRVSAGAKPKEAGQPPAGVPTKPEEGADAEADAELSAQGWGSPLPKGRDVLQQGKGAVHGIWAGAVDATREFTKSAASFGQWLSESTDGMLGPLDIKEYRTLLKANDDPDAKLSDKELWQRINEAGNAALAKHLTPREEDTGAGKFVRPVSQFLTATWMGGKLLKAGGVAGTGVTAVGRSGAVAGGLGFDPDEKKLANLLDEVPALHGPVTEFLATQPGDSEATKRLKGALEAAGLNVAAEGLIHTLSLYRAARAAKRPAGEGGPAKPEVKESDVTAILGGSLDEKAPLVDWNPKQLLEGDAGKVRAEPKPGEKGAPAPAFNWSKINTTDDVVVLMRNVMDRRGKEIDKAVRAEPDAKGTGQLATLLGVDEVQLLKQRGGVAFTHRETAALREIYQAASEKLAELTMRAAANNAGAIDQFAFRKMLAIHAEIQNVVFAARAEAGRNLAAWGTVVSGDTLRAKAIMDALEASGGEKFSGELAQRLKILLANGGNPAKVVREAAGANAWDAVQEVWVNAMLSGPRTHARNISSNAVVAVQQIFERATAERLGAALADQGGVSPGEAAAMMNGLINALPDAWRLAWDALRSGNTGASIGKIDIGHGAPALSARTFGMQDNAMAAAVDFLGTITRVPGRLMASEDEWFKAVGYRMELYAQASRQAYSEGLRGGALQKRMQEIIANPPESVHMASVDAALYATFTDNAGKLAQAIYNLRDMGGVKGAAAFMVFPFVKTPINILRYDLSRTPLAPISDTFRADVAAGGTRAQLALARLGLGTMTMLQAADWADRGLVTGHGPFDPGQREIWLHDHQPYSFRNGKEWVSYEGIEPFATIFGLAANLSEFAAYADMEGSKLEDARKLTQAGIVSVAEILVNKQFLAGWAQLVQIMDPSHPNAAEAFAGKETASILPSLLNTLRAIKDPVQRDQNSIADYFRARTIGLSEGLQPKRDVWGRVIQPNSGMGSTFDAVSPVTIKKIETQPIDAEIMRLGSGLERIPKKTTINGVPMDLGDFPEIYSEYQRLAGNDLKLPGFNKMGAMDFLNRVVEGRDGRSAIYRRLTDGPEGGKAGFIKDTVGQYRKAAQIELLAANPDFRAAWRQARDLQQQKQAPVQGVNPPPTPNIQFPRMPTPN